MKKKILIVGLLVAMLFTGCASEIPSGSESTLSSEATAIESETVNLSTQEDTVFVETREIENVETESVESLEPFSESSTLSFQASTFDSSSLPSYNGSAYVSVNDNIPYFSSEDLTMQSFESYSPLDGKGRCGVAYANVGQDLMPTEERGAIGAVKPTGWHTVKYDNVDGKYLYNRCHLIGYQLTAENANEKNLITGTRYLNIQGMLPFENMVADYVKETNNHVLYRVTPIFDGDNLLASGVLMEGYSVEDDGAGICFCIYAFNVQPGITINYANGDSSSAQESANSNEQQTEQPSAETPEPVQAVETSNEPEQQPVVQPAEPEPQPVTITGSYILNTNTKKFHNPSCSSVGQMKEVNKQEYNGSRDDIIAQGYQPCKKCNP